jgi:hypothetical protein
MWLKAPGAVGRKTDMNDKKKHSRPISWLTSIQTAKTAFVGQARVLEDTWIPAGQASFRAAGYRLTSEIIPQYTLFGSLPDPLIRLQGQTDRPPDARLVPESQFPPDVLRQESYWECARSGLSQPILAMLPEQARVSLLTGPDDELPSDVALIHRWTSLEKAEINTAVLTELAKAGHGPVAYTAGFELLKSVTTDLPGLFSAFVRLPGRPGAAIQGILDLLSAAAASLSGPEMITLARRLLEGWSQENDPAALSGYLLWFDAHRARTWLKDSGIKAAVLAELKRTGALKFTGSYAQTWEQQVGRYAASFSS